MMIWPSVGVSSPEIMRSKVFPQPEGPSSAKNAFWAMSISMSTANATWKFR
jgi:hypothetical protein